jgi:quercetin dioxygenase-like cupin family protein
MQSMNAHVTSNSTLSPETYHFIGSLLTIRACAAQTGDSFTIIESLTAPGAGAPPHRQNDEEAFLVLDGQFEFMLEGNIRVCGPGEFVHIPAGQVHAFRNVAETPSKMLIVNLPGGLHEGFFKAAGEQVASGSTSFPAPAPVDIPALVATAARFEIEILPPPAA